MKVFKEFRTETAVEAKILCDALINATQAVSKVSHLATPHRYLRAWLRAGQQTGIISEECLDALEAFAFEVRTAANSKIAVKADVDVMLSSAQGLRMTIAKLAA